MKTCSRCNKVKSEENFYKGRNQCKSCRLEVRKVYRAKNKDKTKKWSRNWKTSEKGRAYKKRYRRENPACNIYKGKRRHQLRLATPKWADRKKINKLYIKARELGEITGLKYHVDHIIPLNHPDVCGLHIWENLQILEASLNEEKSNKMY